VSGVAVDQGARDGTEPGEENGDEVIGAHILRKSIVEEAEDCAGVRMGECECAQVSASFRYEQRRSDPVAAGIADGDPPMSVRQGDEVVVISAGFLGGMRSARDREAGQDGRGFGEQSLLDCARELELPGARMQHHLRLPADAGHHGKHGFLRLPELGAEELDNAKDVAVAAQGESEGAARPCWAPPTESSMSEGEPELSVERATHAASASAHSFAG
jgi:hypothetical protein